MPSSVVVSRCLEGTLSAPRSFMAYRCDVPGLEGQLAHRTHWVADHPVYRNVAHRFSASSLLELLLAAPTPLARGIVEKMAIEHLFELARIEDHPKLPSRLSSVFLFLTRQAAEVFQQELQPERVIYECTARGWWFQGDSNKIYAATHVLGTAALTRTGMTQAIGGVSDVARRYWGHEFDEVSWPELLLDGEAILLGVAR